MSAEVVGTSTIREYVGLVAAFCVADQARRDEGLMRGQRRAQARLCYDILTVMDGFNGSLDHLRGMGLVPLDRHDLDPIVRGEWTQGDHRASDD